MIINEETELSGKILYHMASNEQYNYYTFKLNDVEKVIRYYGDALTYWDIMYQYFCCRGSNIRVPSNNDAHLYKEALIKLKSGLCLISYISFEIFEEETLELKKVDFLPYFKERSLYEERTVIDLYEDLDNFMESSDKIYKANPSLYSYVCASYECSNNSKNEKDNEAVLNIDISENNIERFDYVIINGIKFKKDKSE